MNPGVAFFSTMKPSPWLSATSRAQMIEMSHHGIRLCNCIPRTKETCMYLSAMQDIETAVAGFSGSSGANIFALANMLSASLQAQSRTILLICRRSARPQLRTRLESHGASIQVQFRQDAHKAPSTNSSVKARFFSCPTLDHMPTA